jgi:hypothetical protein
MDISRTVDDLKRSAKHPLLNAVVSAPHTKISGRNATYGVELREPFPNLLATFDLGHPVIQRVQLSLDPLHSLLHLTKLLQEIFEK